MLLTRTALLALVCAVPTHAYPGIQPDPVAIERALAAPERSAADRDRDKTSLPQEVLGFFGVHPGMRVLDLMSGGGYYSEILSRTVGPGGEVVAHNNSAWASYVAGQPELRFAGGKFPNLRRVQSELDDMGLEEGTFDLVLLVMAYHDIYWISDEWPRVDRDRFFQQIFAALKPGGIVAVIDHAAAAGTGTAAVSELHRIDEEFTRHDFERAGFVLEAQSDLLRNPQDDRTLPVFDERIKGRTDRFIFRFLKPPAP